MIQNIILYCQTVWIKNGSGNWCVLIEISTDCRGLMSQYADLEVMSLVTAWSHTFIKIDHELYSIINLLRYFKEGCC